MDRCRAMFSSSDVNSRASFEKLTYSRRASRTHRAMEGGRAASIDLLKFRSMLNQELNEFSLLCWIPSPARLRAGIASVVQRSSPSTIFCIRVRSALKKKLRGSCSQGGRRQVQGRVPYVEPMRNRFDQVILPGPCLRQIRRSSQELRYRFVTFKDCLKNWTHSSILPSKLSVCTPVPRQNSIRLYFQ